MLLFVFIFLLISSVSEAVLSVDCAAKYAAIENKILEYDSKSDDGKFSLKTHLEPHVKAAFDTVWSTWKRRGDSPPLEEYATNPQQDAFEEKWVAAFPAANPGIRKIGTRRKPVATNVVQEGPTNPVVSIGKGENKKYFFALGKSPALNSRYLASKIANKLGIDTVTGAEFVSLNGKLGLLVDHAPGSGFYRRKNSDRMAQLVDEGKVSESSFADAEAYEFLINNTDAHGQNIRISPDGTVRVIDHDLAFGESVPSANRESRDGRAVGNSLPQRYTKKFADNLKRMDATEIHSMCDGVI